MSVLVVALAVALLLVVVFVVSAPLRRAPRRLNPVSAGRAGAQTAAERDRLEAARESKYREIRDAELDYRTGKLSREDYAAIDAVLRREAVEILNELEAEESLEAEET